MTPVDVAVTPGPARSVVTVIGEVDLSNVDRLRQALSTGTARDHTLVVDLSGVGYIDSAGIAALFGRATAGPLEIVCPEEGTVRAVIEVTRLGQVAVIRGT